MPARGSTGHARHEHVFLLSQGLIDIVFPIAGIRKKGKNCAAEVSHVVKRQKVVTILGED